MRKSLFTILTLLLTFTFYTGCSKVDDATLLAAHKAVEQGAVIMDVRTIKEYQQGHIESAINIPVEEISKSLARVPKKRVLVVYCQSGSRSSYAAKILTKNGWTVYDVATQSEFEREVKEPLSN